MRSMLLTVRNGDGIFAATENTEDRRLELRARSLLAYGYKHKHINPMIDESNSKKNIVILDINGRGLDESDNVWMNGAHLNTGRIFLSDAGREWDQQPGRMILILSKEISPDLALGRYFHVPLKWLKDRGFERMALSKLFESKAA